MKTHRQLEQRVEIRTAFADYVYSEGCSCCRDEEAHQAAAKKLAKLLKVPPYMDASGYDFTRFSSDSLAAAKKRGKRRV